MLLLFFSNNIPTTATGTLAATDAADIAVFAVRIVNGWVAAVQNTELWTPATIQAETWTAS